MLPNKTKKKKEPKLEEQKLEEKTVKKRKKGGSFGAIFRAMSVKSRSKTQHLIPYPIRAQQAYADIFHAQAQQESILISRLVESDKLRAFLELDDDTKTYYSLFTLCPDPTHQRALTAGANMASRRNDGIDFQKLIFLTLSQVGDYVTSCYQPKLIETMCEREKYFSRLWNEVILLCLPQSGEGAMSVDEYKQLKLIATSWAKGDPDSFSDKILGICNMPERIQQVLDRNEPAKKAYDIFLWLIQLYHHRYMVIKASQQAALEETKKIFQLPGYESSAKVAMDWLRKYNLKIKDKKGWQENFYYYCQNALKLVLDETQKVDGKYHDDEEAMKVLKCTLYGSRKDTWHDRDYEKIVFIRSDFVEKLLEKLGDAAEYLTLTPTNFVNYSDNKISHWLLDSYVQAELQKTLIKTNKNLATAAMIALKVRNSKKETLLDIDELEDVDTNFQSGYETSAVINKERSYSKEIKQVSLLTKETLSAELECDVSVHVDIDGDEDEDNYYERYDVSFPNCSLTSTGPQADDSSDDSVKSTRFDI